jgi:hypothetical protein
LVHHLLSEERLLMDDTRPGRGRPHREHHRLHVVAVPQSMATPCADREIRRGGRLRSDRRVDAAFASLQKLGVEILSGRPATPGPKSDSLMPANGARVAPTGPVPMGPLRRLLARSRG